MKKLLWIAFVVICLAVPYELFANNTIFMMVINMLRGLAIMAILYCLIIWTYFRLRKKIDKKYIAEIGTIVFVLVLSVVGKVLAIIMDVGRDGSISVQIPKDGLNSVSAIYYSLYQAIGGLSFEGLANYDYYESWRTIIYAGTSVLAGLVAISIITFSFSYEIYSTASWMMTWKRNRKIYIFTAVTEDSVMLAHSIADHYEESKKKRQRAYLIIFLRTEDQEGFDSKNPLHLDIMHSGFFFMSYSPGKKNRSIPAFLNIKVHNDGCLAEEMKYRYKDSVKKGKMAEVHVFALDWEKDKTSENDKIVCEDVARITAEVFGKGLSVWQKIKLCFHDEYNKDKNIKNKDFLYKLYDYHMMINYHYLVDGDVDVANVDFRFEKEISKFAKKGERELTDAKVDYAAIIGEMAIDALTDLPVDKNDEVAKAKRQTFLHYKRHFLFDAINEANMAAFSFIRKKGKMIEKCPDLYANDLKSDAYRALVIGFGQNGQQAMKLSYIFAAAGEYNVSDEPKVKTNMDIYMKPGNEDGEVAKNLQKCPFVIYKPQPYIADVYDKNASEVGGLFRLKHPSIRVIMQQNENRSYEYDFAPVRVVLHNESAYNNKILEKLDKNLGETDMSEYNLIIIALGDDDRNVSIANAILEDSKHEKLLSESLCKNILMKAEEKIAFTEEEKEKLSDIKDKILKSKLLEGKTLTDAEKEKLKCALKKEDKYQVVAINLRNKLNYDRINWKEKDEVRFSRIKVIKFGSADEMYSYDNIVDNSSAKIWNYGYEMISRENNENKTLLTKGVLKRKINDAIIRSAGSAQEDKETIVELLSGICYKLDENKAEQENYWCRINKPEMYYSRLSSVYACEMPVFIKNFCVAKNFCQKGCFGKVTLTNLIRLGGVEHDRWVRFMIAYGYKPGVKKDLYFKEHDCIRDYKYLNSQLYDIINVLNALATDSLK